MSAVYDTSLLLDYLRGEPRAEKAFARHAHRAISVVLQRSARSHAPSAQDVSAGTFLAR